MSSFRPALTAQARMPNTHLRKLSKTAIQAAVTVAVFVFPDMRLQAQSAAGADSPAGYHVFACTTQNSGGSQVCNRPSATRFCDTEATSASLPSKESTGISFVNRSDKPVKVYWLNFQGQRVLYNSNLAPGARQPQQTFVGHNWVVTTQAEQCLAIFTTDSRPVSAEASVARAPPDIPVYDQPPPPEDDLVWTPGYWNWSADINDYYWVPGAWVSAPIVGYLWTPGYWVIDRGLFYWRSGYWGPHVGFYGGINYGHGYFGHGFDGAAWRDGHLIYNSAATNVANLRSTHVYLAPVVDNISAGRVSYNGAKGISAQANAEELSAAAEYHLSPTAAQLQDIRAAHDNTAMRADTNKGHPSLSAIAQPRESSNASLPAGPHAGTLSVTHFTPPPHPAHPAGRVGSSKTSAEASTTTSATRAPSQPGQQPAHVAKTPAEQQSKPEAQPPREKSSSTERRAVPHTEGRQP